ncbi:hypothetical protein [Burkholderia sp. 3C]
MAARIAVIDWHGAMRDGRHLLMGATAISFAWRLFLWGDSERSAAIHGDLRVRAIRKMIRTALHWDGAVSTLEHALSGVGIAFIGVGILQLYYFAAGAPTAGSYALPQWLRWSFGCCLAVVAAVFVWCFRYGESCWLVLCAVIVFIGWGLARRDRLRRLALATPAYFIGLVSALPWLNFEFSWKLQRSGLSGESVGVVLAHLLVSGVSLLAVSLAVGTATQRYSALRPTAR